MIRLVDNWKKVHTWLSVQFAAILSTAGVIYAEAPNIIQQYIPHNWFMRGMAITGVLVIIGRIVKQGKDDKPQT